MNVTQIIATIPCTVDVKFFDVPNILIFVGAQAAFLSCQSVLEKFVSEIFKKEKINTSHLEKNDETWEMVYRSNAAEKFRNKATSYMRGIVCFYILIVICVFLTYIYKPCEYNNFIITPILALVTFMVGILFHLMVKYRNIRNDFGFESVS